MHAGCSYIPSTYTMIVVIPTPGKIFLTQYYTGKKIIL